jgi:hypothetical protein
MVGEILCVIPILLRRVESKTKTKKQTSLKLKTERRKMDDFELL